jgi:hypothetical protein
MKTMGPCRHDNVPSFSSSYMDRMAISLLVNVQKFLTHFPVMGKLGFLCLSSTWA